MKKVLRPWGYFRVILKLWKVAWVKVLVVNPWCRTSLQWHRGRSELWLPIGRLWARYELVTVCTRLPFYVPAIIEHRLANYSDKPLWVIELAWGRCEEHDIHREDDDWGRC